MKNKIIYLAAMASVCLVCLGIGQLDEKESAPRIHQHKKENNTLPVINVNTNGQEFDFIDDTPVEIMCDFSMKYKGEELTSQASMRARGYSSLNFDKKSYALSLVLEDGEENHLGLAGMSEHNEWVLNGPFLDKTLMRNYMCMNISGEIMDYAPNVRYCRLYVNNEYRGLYVLMETITRGKGRLDITKPENGRAPTSYIVHYERKNIIPDLVDSYSFYTYKSGASGFAVRYPGETLITPSRMDYIKNDISDIEKILYSYDLKVRNEDYTDYIDIGEFAEYFIINEFFGNKDAGWYSTYFYKDVRGKLKPCVWDFNNACDNFQEQSNGTTGFTMHKAPWFEALIKDERFVDEVVRRYRKLRKGVLSEEYLLNYVSEVEGWISEERVLNYKVWNYVWNPDITKENYPDNYLMPSHRNPRTYREAVRQLRQYIIDRGNWMDQNIDNLYQYCHDSRNANELIR